ncbi:SDR family oxidoreductase [Saccharibacter floricola]|uniref:Oxidoreductase n=1 Tax=Saccharibacter floricola DSM 15669 TaxID=1123227 RepID=A0ABQ0NYL6_9PROT|nr:SDR family oxidoreductase [Saccharibacter floricola]GBQ06239.1 oxidoreductase [Saccharibacter floricola DSM 15669]
MDMQLSQRFAIIMGGSAGLGAGIARSLAAEGVHVCLIARREQPLRNMVEIIENANGKASWISADLSTLEGVQKAITHIQQHYPKAPDIIIGNGGGPPPGPASVLGAQLWQHYAEAMLMPTMAMTDTFLPSMRQQEFGRIIMVSSTSIKEPIQGLVLSNALRSALASWGKTLAREVGPDGITVNTLMPGRFDTDRVAKLNASRAEQQHISVEELKRRKEQEIPVGRYGEPDEFGAMATFLASPRASYITGACIPVDGGLLRSW